MAKKNKHFDRGIFDAMINEFQKKYAAEFDKPNWFEIISEILNNEANRLESKVERSKSSMQLNQRNCSFSDDTVKRVFGVVKYSKNHNIRTCNIIARTLGAEDWEEFCKKTDERLHNNCRPILYFVILVQGASVSI